MTTTVQVNPEVARNPARPWRAMFRVECTGGSVSEAIAGCARYMPEKTIYAEGDSWFDKFTPIPTSGTNLLDAIRLPFVSVVVDVSKIGSEASEMASGQQARQTRAMFNVLKFDAILLSAGGNDLKNLFADLFEGRAAQGGDKPWTQQEVDEASRPARYTDFFDKICGHITTFVRLRDAGKRTGKDVPIFLHGYDYLQPRNAGATVLAGTNLGTGPWLYPGMKRAGLKPAQMRQITDAMVDELNSLLAALANKPENVNVHYLDQRGLLKPASASSTGPDADWMDEIHPKREGFEKLARNCWDVPVAQALGWVPSSESDLIAGDDDVNGSTALG